MTTVILIASVLILALGLVIYGSARRKGRGTQPVPESIPAKTPSPRPAPARTAPHHSEHPAEQDPLKGRLRNAIDLLFSDAPADQPAPRHPLVRATVSPEVLREAAGQVGSSAEFGTVAQLQRLLMDSNFDAGQVSKFIASDPVLSGKVLKLANSSAFGVSGKVDSIGHALMLIGTSNVVNHLCFSSLSNAFSEATVLKGCSVASLWQHATATSICALNVGYLFPELNRGKLYTMALLHDLGKFLMGRLPLQSPGQPAGDPDPATDIALEETLYGINHAALGAMVLESWHIPESIAKPVELHHHPASVSTKDLGVTVEKLQSTTVLYLADQLARVFLSAERGAPPVLPLHPSYRKLLDRQQLEQNILGSPLTAEVKKAMALTQVLALSPETQAVEVGAAH